jgi:hypothetical protein
VKWERELEVLFYNVGMEHENVERGHIFVPRLMRSS